MRSNPKPIRELSKRSQVPSGQLPIIPKMPLINKLPAVVGLDLLAQATDLSDDKKEPGKTLDRTPFWAASEGPRRRHKARRQAKA
jgi:hypothetical protein